MAHALDRVPDRAVEGVEVERRGGRLRIHLQGSEGLEAAAASARPGADFLEKAFDCRVQLVSA